MRKRLFLIVIIMLIFCPIIFTGCSSGKVSIYIKTKPTKIAYEINEPFSKDGLKVESLNTDGTTTKVKIKDEDIVGADTSSGGEKTVTCKSGNNSTVFNIYVADVVVNSGDNVRQKILDAKSGDVVYFKNGTYDNSEGQITDIVIDKSLFIVGESKDKTIFKGNFIVGVTKSQQGYEKIENFKDVKIVNMGFKQDIDVKNGEITYKNGIKVDNYGAICGFDTENLYVTGCSFENYSYGVLMNNAINLSVTRNTFKNLLISGVKVKNHSERVSIFKNAFMDIGTNVLFNENESQSYLSCINLSFSKKGNAGIIISQNSFNRVALKTDGWIYFDENSKDIEGNDNLTKLSYVNNSAIVVLKSSSENNLQVSEIVLTANNYGGTLQNIKLGTTDTDKINQSGMIINETF